MASALRMSAVRSVSLATGACSSSSSTVARRAQVFCYGMRKTHTFSGSALHSQPLRSSAVPAFQVAPRTEAGSKLRASYATASASATTVEDLRGAKQAIVEIVKTTSSNPILIRLGWHDAGTFDKDAGPFPNCGGANGSLVFEVVQKHGANAGLNAAVKLLEPVKAKYPSVSWADLFQLASAVAVELAGGPVIPMRYGRLDIAGVDQVEKEGNLPDAAPPSPSDHLRKVFYRMGLNDKEIVALSGAHTLGRARPDRSGFGVAETKYTKDGPGKPGGQSWTVEWLRFDNSYFKDIKAKKDSDLLVLPTDAVLFEDAGFKVYAEKYATDEKAFFADYALAHAKLSELGSKFEPAEGIKI